MPGTRTQQYDAIVLGSGVAGLSAAVSACRNGLKTLLLERAPRIGGGTTLSAGLIWVGSNHLAKAIGIQDKREAVREYMDFLDGGQAIRENSDTFIDQSPRALKFYEKSGIPFRLAKGVPDHYFGIAPSALAFGRTVEVELVSGKVLGKWRNRVVRPLTSPDYMTAEELITWGGINNFSNWDPAIVAARKKDDMRGVGVGLITHLLRLALESGVEIRMRQRVVELKIELENRGRRVAGVTLANGESLRARAGVVIATGGYESNPAMVSDYEGLPDFLSMFPTSLQGDGLVLGTRAGGAVHFIQNHMQLFLGFPVPVGRSSKEFELRLAGIIEMCSPHTMVVNDAGERFADESYFQRMVPKLRLFDVDRHRHPNLPCFLIFDRQYAEQYSFAGRPAGAEVPDWVQRAPTAAALAGKLEIDPRGLERTVARFNQDIAAGEDTAFGRGKAKWAMAHDLRSKAPRTLGKLEKPPFFGIQLMPSAASSAGLLTNKHAQVLQPDRHPVAGLYAIGNAAARVEYGVGYQAGLTLASGLTFGLLAAEHMRRRLARS